MKQKEEPSNKNKMSILEEKAILVLYKSAMIRAHDSQIVFGLEQPSDKLMTVDLI